MGFLLLWVKSKKASLFYRFGVGGSYAGRDATGGLLIKLAIDNWYKIMEEMALKQRFNLAGFENNVKCNFTVFF